MDEKYFVAKIQYDLPDQDSGNKYLDLMKKLNDYLGY